MFRKRNLGYEEEVRRKKLEAAHMRFLGLRLVVSLQDRKANAKISLN